MRYKWPGNVRQLKNMTEQLSILSPSRTITPEILSQYIPQDRESTQLAVITNRADHSFENERELLYKILFELRGNVSDMRREMSQLKKQLDDVQRKPSAITNTQIASVQPQPYTLQSPAINGLEDAEAEEYIEPTPDQENLNLSVLSRQMLEKALERNSGNRKRAAQELGISDRTLYRRLKQYGMEKE